MTTNTEPTVCRQSLIDERCPFCGAPARGQEAIRFDDDGEIRQDQTCWTCGEEWRVYYGPVGVVHGDDYLPATTEMDRKNAELRHALDAAACVVVGRAADVHEAIRRSLAGAPHNRRLQAERAAAPDGMTASERAMTESEVASC